MQSGTEKWVSYPEVSMVLEPNVYREQCPTRLVLDRVADKWTTLIISMLEGKPKRFSELHRCIEGISQKMLTQTLRGLERDGLVKRTLYPEVPLRVEYELTPLGKTLWAPLRALCDWAEANIDAVETAQAEYDTVKA